MTNFTVELPEALPRDICREISKRACYCDSSVVKCRYLAETNELLVELADHHGSPAVRDKILLLVDKMKSNRLAVQPRRLHSRSRRDNDFHPEVFSDLSDRGDLKTEGIGVVSRSGRFLELVTALDFLLQRIGTDVFNARVLDYNTLIPSDWLNKAGYFSAFAHSVTFAMHLREDYDQLDDFALRHQNSRELGFKTLEELATPEYCLTPAVCYHTYGEYENSRLTDADNGLKVVTASGRCFRYESKNITDLDRLWEFSMREIVFVGEKDKVLAVRKRSLEVIWQLMEMLDLTAFVETASDPFFSTEFNSLRFFQLANDLKFELLVPVEADKSVAAASFNYHEDFFGEKFNIETASGGRVHTGCAAFGLERLALACLAQIGFEETMVRLGRAAGEILRE